MNAVASPDKEWITVSEAVELAGCTEGYLRRLLGEGDKRLTGWKAGARAWLVRKADVVELGRSLTTRSNARRHERTGRNRRRSRKTA
jgi:excisionase family DNA binding protein